MACIDIRAKAGGFLLAFILCLALTTWGWRMLAAGRSATTAVGLAGLAGLCLAYLASYFVVDRILSASVPDAELSPTLQLTLLTLVVMFALSFAWVAALGNSRKHAWIPPLRVHAANGFYIDAISYRVFGSLTKS